MTGPTKLKAAVDVTVSLKVTAFSNVELAENVVLPVKVELLKLPLAEAGAKDKLPLPSVFRKCPAEPSVFGNVILPLAI